MKKKTSLIVALSSITVCALFAVPSKINYQGLITDTAGEPIESSTNTVTVTLYQAETDGTSVYTESFTDVASDADGLYSIQIGDTNLQAVLEANSELWLELTINEQTLSPRQEINSVPYALVADSANRLINASDSSISGNLSVSGNSTLNGISVTGPASLDSLSVEDFAYFSSAIFDDITVMGPASFSSSAYFNGISVMGPASFSSTASFSGISVMGPASLDSLSVGGPASFSDISVTGPASLDSLSVMSSGYFGGIEVSGTATFSGIDVNGSAYFGPEIMVDYYGFHAYNPDVGASSYIGRDPITGNYGNRLAGTTIIDSLNTSSLSVSGNSILNGVSVTGPASLDSLSVMSSGYFGGIEVSGTATFSGIDVNGSAYFGPEIMVDYYGFHAYNPDVGASSYIGRDPITGNYGNRLAGTTIIDSLNTSSLNVSGNSILNGVSVTGPASLDSLSVMSSGYFGGIEVSGTATFSGIDVNGSAYFGPEIMVDYYGFHAYNPDVGASSYIGRDPITGNYGNRLAGTTIIDSLNTSSLNVSGNSILNGISVTGPASLDSLSVMSSGYFGGIEVSGTATFSGIDVNGSAYFGPGIMADYYGFHAYNPDVGASSYIGRDPITGNYGNRLAGTTIIDSLNTSSLNVSGTMTLSDVSVSGTAVFINASSVTVPEPSADNEATNKAYVDNLVSTSIASDNAKGLVQLAVTENVSNLSEYYLTYESGGSTLNPAQGDLVLLTGQTTTSENGIYEVSSVNLSSSYSSSSSSSGPTASDYYVSLTRASNFDSAEEFVTGSFVFVEKGAQVGQGYVLGELASGFTLGTSALNYIQFTVDTTIIENNSENITTAADNISNNTDAISILHGRTSVLEGSSSMWTDNADAISLLHGRTSVLEGSSSMWTDNADAISLLHGRTSVLEGSSSMWTDNADAIAVLQSDVDQNESDADTAIADIKTGDTVFSGSPSFTGVKPLPSGQTDYTSNYYELQPWNTPSSDVPNFATVNVDGLLNADVINAEGMLRVGNLYITENEFRSDYGQVNIDNLRTHSLDVRGDIMFDGYRADFEMAEEVRVPTPDQDYEATNKAYVDAAIATNATAITAEATTARAAEQANATAITALQSDVDQNESDADNAIAAEATARASAITAAVSGDINASSLTTSGDLSVSGNSTFSGNSSFNNDIDVMGRGRFDSLDVMGPMMASGIDASEVTAHGRLRTYGMLDVSGDIMFDGYRADFEMAEEVRVPTPDQDNEATNKAYVDSLVSTSIASDNAKGLVQLAVTENVSNLSEYYLTYESGGSTLNPAQGDLVLLTGQTTTSENGIYEVSSVNLSSSYSSSSSSSPDSSGPTASDYYVSLTRASNFDSAEEFVTGSFVFVEKGAQVGQGYVLGELASGFTLGTSALNYIQFTVDTTSDVAFDQSVSASSLTTSGDLSVSGNSTFSGTSTFDGTLRSNGMLEVIGPASLDSLSVGGPASFSDIDASEVTAYGRLRSYGMLDVSGPAMFSDIDASMVTAHGRLRTYGMLDVSGDIMFDGYRADFEMAQEVRVPTPDQDNEATNKAYVDAAIATNATAITAEATTARAAEQANATAITALQSDVDQNESDADNAIAAEATARASAITAAVSGDINASSLTTSGDLSVSGNSTFSGNSSFSGTSTFDGTLRSNGMLEVSGPASFIDISVMGPASFSDIDASEVTAHGRLRTYGMLEVSGPAMFSDIDASMVTAHGRLRTYGMLDVSGDIMFDGYRADFEMAEEVRVPTPDQDNEATNKAYVDNLVSTSIASDNAKGLVQLAVTENVSNLSEYYLTYESGGSTLNPAQGDLVLLTGQTTTSENGIYEVSSVNLSSSYSSSSSSSGPTASDYYVSLTRAPNFDSAEEFVTGSFVFVEKGAQVGQGYVLGELASGFALGTSALNYIQFTVDTTSDVAFDQSVSASSLTTSGDLSVSGNSTFSGNSSFSGTSTFDGTLRSNGMLEVSGPAMFSNIDASEVTAHGRLRTYGMLEVRDDIMFDGYRADFEMAEQVRVPTPDQDNEATNKAYVDAAIATNATAITAEAATARAAEQANATAITALQSDVDQNESDADTAIADIKTGDTVFSGSPSFTGVKPLPSGQTNYTSNYYELRPEYTSSSDVPNYATVNVDGLLNADVINAEGMLRVGELYITGNEIGSNYGQVDINAIETYNLDVTGGMMFDGYRADFELAQEVRVPTPDQDNEATNKAYVDSAITALQSDVDQNESDADTAIADIKTGDTVFSGSPSFTGVKPLPSGQTNYTSNYYELRPEYTSSSDVPNYATVNVDGLLNADVINAEGMLRVGELYITGNEIGSNYGQVDINAIETYNLDVTGGMMFDGYRADFELAQEVRVPTPDQDNEATNKAYVDSAITAEAIARASAITTAVSGDINASSLTTSGAIITNNLNVGGSVTATEFIAASDYRFKDNIKTITGAVDKVKQLRGVEYTLKSNGKDSVGVIAQEVEEVYPQLVSTSDELEGITDAKAVNYSSLIGVLIEAIKEQQTQIEDLKAQVNVLNESTNNQATNTILATFETQQ